MIQKSRRCFRAMGYFWNVKEVLLILVYVNEGLRKTHNFAKKGKRDYQAHIY